MVVFTCNHCGDSLQKPKVEKHYETTCRRNSKSVTCVDCLKDFRLEEYASHTKCVSEVERYAAKGAVFTTPRGEKKQNEWMDTIKSIIEEEKDSALPGVKLIFDHMTNSVNVPRKKKQFANFLNNALGKRINENDIENTWNIIQNRLPKQTNTSNENGTEENKKTSETTTEQREKGGKKKKKTKKNKNDVTETNGKQEEIKTDKITEENTGKKKKSKQVNDENDVQSNETTEEHTEKKNKKKKSKDVINNIAVVEANEPIVEVEEKKDKSKKKKSKQSEEIKVNNEKDVEINENITESKKSKKKRKAQTDVAEPEITPEKKIKEDETVENDNKKSKKKKSKNIEIESETQNEIKTDVSLENVSKKNKKRKLKESESEESALKKKKVEQNGTSENSGKFCWVDTIKEVLKKHPNGLPIDELKRKVFQKYEEHGAKIDNTTLEKRYKKKFNLLRKAYTVENDIIKPVV